MFCSHQIKKLSATNYNSSSINVKFLLHEKNCFDIVNGREVLPVETETTATKPAVTKSEVKDFLLRKRLALSIIFLNISDEYKKLVENIDDPKEAWELLRRNFHPNNRSFI